MSHVSHSFQLLSLSSYIFSSQSNLMTHVRLGLPLSRLPCRLLLLFSAEYHNALMAESPWCVSHYVPRIRQTFCFSSCLSQLFTLHQFSVVHQYTYIIGKIPLICAYNTSRPINPPCTAALCCMLRPVHLVCRPPL